MQKSKILLVMLALLLVGVVSASAETDIPDGLYTIDVISNASMFKVVNCTLMVNDGTYRGTLTMSSTGYGYLFPGTGAEADLLPRSEWAHYFVGDAVGHMFTIPVEKLDTEIDVASWSIRKEKWYERRLIFDSSTLTPCTLTAPKGKHTATMHSDLAVLEATSIALTSDMGKMHIQLPRFDAKLSAVKWQDEEYAVSEQGVSLPLPSMDTHYPIALCLDGQWTENMLWVDASTLVTPEVKSEDGVFDITVKSDSGLFKVESAVLSVENATMTAKVTANPSKYTMLFVGKSADALKQPEKHIIVTPNAEGLFTFDVTVPTLDVPVVVSTYDASKKMWYERKLTFLSESKQLKKEAEVAKALLPLDDFSFSGGSGRVTISCEGIAFENDVPMATIVFSSKNYTQVKVDGTVYPGISTDKTSTFVIPVQLNATTTIVATTVAMSSPKDIEYQLQITFKDASKTSKAPLIEGLTYVSTVPLRYAEGFSLHNYEDGYTLIDIVDSGTFLVVPEGKNIPNSLPKSITPLHQPLDRIYLVASATMALFDALDGLEHLKFSGTAQKGWYIDNAVKAMENGDLLFAGKYNEPDFELLLSKGCQLAIESTMILHSPKTKEMLEMLGIAVLIERSSFESHPLGRTEWIKLYGALIGKEAEAEAYFNQQAKIMEAAKQFAKTGKTIAFFYIASDGTVRVRNRTDYLVKMIQIAGGEYAYTPVITTEETRSSVSISMEDFYKATLDADYIVYNATIDDPITEIAQLLAKSETMADFKAVKEGNVYCTDKYLYQATDILGTLIRDFHLMLQDDDTAMTFLHKVN